jgi:streptogramin lyase
MDTFNRDINAARGSTEQIFMSGRAGSRKTKRSANVKKYVVLGVAAALIGSIVAVVYQPPAPPLGPARALFCGSGIPNSNNYIQEFLLPTQCSEPVGITVDENGIVWFAESAARKIGKFDPSTKRFEEFALPDAKPQEQSVPIASIWDLKFDDEGNLWFPDVVANSIWKFDPSRKKFEQFRIPSTSEFGTSYPINFDFDGNGNIWFSEIFGKSLGRLDPSRVQHNTSMGISEMPVKVYRYLFTWNEVPGSQNDVVKRFVELGFAQDWVSSANIVKSTDGNVIRISAGDKSVLLILNSTTNRVNLEPENPSDKELRNVRFEFFTNEANGSLSIYTSLESLGPLAIDQEGNIWFTALTYPIVGYLLKFNPDQNAFTKYNMPSGVTSPVGIVTDEHGNLWVNDHGTSMFVKFDSNANPGETYIPDANGNLWLREELLTDSNGQGEMIGELVSYVTSLPRASTSLGLYEQCLTQPNGTPATCGGMPVSLPYWNRVDKDGKIWFNLHQGNAIAVFDPLTETLIEYFLPSQNREWAACENYDEPCGIGNPLQFAIAWDGKVWFTEWSESRIGALDPKGTLPVKLDLSDSDVSASHGKPASIELSVTASEALDSPVEMRISSTIVQTGRLFNMTAQFSEQIITFSEPSTKTVTLSLIPEAGLVPGEYRVTVSAQHEEVTYSKILHLVIEPSEIR